MQNYGFIPDFDLFLHAQNSGPSPRWTRDRVARSPEHGLLVLRSTGARRGLGKMERSSKGCSPRASVADSTVR